jgi:S1-C subfamily serine protease
VTDAYQAAGFVNPGKPAAVVVKRDGKEVKLTVSPKPGL